MNRDYESGEADNAVFFVGTEVERTPAYGLRTLFVTGIQLVDQIEKHYNDELCQHIFFGANHSFNPIPQNYDSWLQWETLIQSFLDQNYLCTLDIPMTHVAEFHETGLCEYDNFIPQIRVPIPYVKLWNYNTMIKIDDKDFKASNPGVWCHSLHDLMAHDKFTDWQKYRNDKVLK